MNQITPPELDPSARQALEALDAAGLEYTIVCTGNQPHCLGWTAAVAA
jgi:hypothetical protein